MPNQPSPSRGWIVVLAGLAANLTLGSLYAWSVMGKALVVQWGWTRASAALPFTASTLAFATSMIFAGRLQDRIGPKMVAAAGGLMLGLGLIASGWARNPMIMIITFGVVGGIGIGLGYSATTPPALKWFPPHRKGMISGIVVSGIGLAAIIWAPLTAKLLTHFSIEQSFMIMGGITIITVIAMALLLMNPPAGYQPPMGAAAGAAKRAAAPRDVDWAEMLSTAAFWKLWGLMVLGASAGLMIISQIALIVKNQGNIEAGFKFVMVVALFNTAGRLISGTMSDKMGRTNTMALFFFLQAINMLCFRFYDTQGLLLFGAAAAGFCYGPIFPLFPSATADFYGMKNLGVNYGLVFTAFGVAGTLGPIISARIADANDGSYHNAYYICAALLAAGLVLAFMTKPPVFKQQV